MRERICLFYINWANRCIEKGDIKKGLKLLEISLMFASEDEKQYLKEGLMGIIYK